MVIFLKKKIEEKMALAILSGVFLAVVLVIWLSYKNFKLQIISLSDIPPFPRQFISAPEDEEIAKFSSVEDFRSYLKKVETTIGYFGIIEPVRMFKREIGSPALSMMPLAEQKALPERVAETNVQVPGIDEPDILKTDGKNIYFSPGRIWPIWQESIIFWEEKKIKPFFPEPKTKVIKAFPPADLTLEREIEKSGDLLLIKNILIIFSGQEIFSYDVSDPKKPERKWELKLDEKNSIVTSRLYKDKIYLVTKNLIDKITPCPIKPFLMKGEAIEIPCQEIYHPVLPVPVDVTFVASILDPLSGQIEKKISFVGSSGRSVVYISEKSLYITYTYFEDFVKIFSHFFKEKAQDLFPSQVLEKLEKLVGYDISLQAKFVELEMILEDYLNSLEEDESLRIENELENRITDYFKERKRDLEKSGILKINLENFEIAAVGKVPGFPLNQFALDEYKENLRIAVTVGERFWGFGLWPAQIESANDVYILDKNLKILGKIENLGITERIYSARFIEDKGYLVTFREIDPFYVLDLSNPQKPELKGELKIPGYSSYLHPISKDKILGIGKENWQVKISLFDVSLPENPKELDKYILDETFSEILKTHHAFLLDKKHQVFFLPGSKGGYIFSYKDNKLKLVKAVSQISARRAIYINDYLYIIGDNKITVLNEINWQKVKDLEINYR